MPKREKAVRVAKGEVRRIALAAFNASRKGQRWYDTTAEEDDAEWARFVGTFIDGFYAGLAYKPTPKPPARKKQTRWTR